MAYNPKKPNLGYNNNYDPFFDKERLNRRLNENKTESFLVDEVIKPKIQFQEAQDRIRKDNNLNLNSLKILSRKAFNEDFNYADQYASSLMNRINNAKSTEELNSVTKDLESLSEKAKFHEGTLQINPVDNITGFNILKGAYNTTREFFWKGFDFTSQALTSTNIFPESMSFVKHVKGKQEELEKLREANNFDEIDEGLKSKFINSPNNANEMFKTVQSNILRKQNEFKALKLVDSIPNAKEELFKALNNPDKQNAFNKLLESKINLDRQIRGNELYREDPEEFNNLSKGIKNAISTKKYSGYEKYFDYNKEDLYFKHDQEKDLLGSFQYALNREIQAVSDNLRALEESNVDKNDPEFAKQLAAEKKKFESLKSQYNQLEERKNNLSKIYGVEDDNIAERSFWNFGQQLASFAQPLYRDDFRLVTGKNAIVRPTVITEDKYGNPVMSNQFTYIKKDGSTGYNYGAIPELGSGIVGQILPTLALGEVTGGFMKGFALEKDLIGRAAISTTKAYDKLNKSYRLADRLSTFTSVTLTTMPSMIEEEKRWGGNYIERGLGKAMIEGLTEGIGFPDIGSLKAKSIVLDLGSASRRIANSELKFPEKLWMGTKVGAQVLREGYKQNIVEAFEEEMSLLGNAMLEHSIFDQSMFEKDGRERTKIDGESIYDTFVESFAGGLVYSGGNSFLQAKATFSNDNLSNLSNWQAANNPELFKAKLVDLNQKGKISDDELRKGIARVNELSQVFEANVMSFNNLRDTRTLLGDKDKQYQLFTDMLRRNDLVQINPDALTEEQKQELAKTSLKAELDSPKFLGTLNRLRELISVLENKKAEREKAFTESTVEKTKEELDQKQKEDEDDSNSIEKLNELYFNLKAIKRNKSELSKEDLEVLTQAGVIADPILTFSQEDLEKEIARVDQSILKNTRQIEKYVGMSEQEKDNAIIKLFEDSAKELDTVDDPDSLEVMLSSLRKSLDYMKTNTSNVKPIEIEQREKLYDAIEARYQKLLEKDENGKNSVENYFDSVDFYANIKDPKKIAKILEEWSLLKRNKKHIEKSLYDMINDNLYRIYAENVQKTIDGTPEERLDILTAFYETMANKSPMLLYNVQVTNERFELAKVNNDGEVISTTSPNFTQEEVDQARQRVIEKRAKRNAENIAKGKKPYDQKEQEEEPIVTEEEEDSITEEENEEIKKTTDKIFNTLNDQGGLNVDEEGVSEVLNEVQRMYEKNKDKGVAYLKGIATNLIKRAAAYSPNFNSLYQKLMSLNTDVFNGKLSLEEFEDRAVELIKENQKKSDEIELYAAFVGLLYKNNIVSKKVTSSEVKDDEVTSEEKGKKTTSQTDEDPFIKRRDQEITIEEQQKVDQLINLTSPLRTIGVELNENNEPSTNEVELRRVRHINKMSEEDFDKKPKIALMNRQKFMKMYLEAKFPNKTKEEIENDLNLINNFFETSDEGDAIPNEVISLIGENLFSSDVRTGNVLSQVQYWQRNKGKGFSKSPDVVVTLVDANGDLYMFEDGFPLDLNTSAESTNKTIPWRVSSRVMADLKEMGISEEQVLNAHKDTWEAFKALKKEITEDNSKVVKTDYRLTEGVVVSANEFTLGQVLKEVNPTIKKANINDFQVATSSETSTMFGKTAAFSAGRLYFNNEGDPIRLRNTLISKEEAEALAELVFNETYPNEFEEVSDFQDYLFNLINDVSKENRIYFKPNRNYGEPGEPHTNVILRSKDSKKLKQLTKEEFIEYLQKSYFKVSKSYLEKNKSIPRYKMVNGNVEVINPQSYLDYILSTHTFPNLNGEISKNVNKLVYFKIPELNKSTKVTTKTVVVKAPSLEGKELDSQGFVVQGKSSPYMPDLKETAVSLFIGTRKDVIQALKDSGIHQKSLDFFENMSDEDFDKFLNDLVNAEFNHITVLDKNQKRYNVFEKYLESDIDSKYLTSTDIEEKENAKKDEVEVVTDFKFKEIINEGLFVVLKVNDIQLRIPATSKEKSKYHFEYFPQFKMDKGTTVVSDKSKDSLLGLNPLYLKEEQEVVTDSKKDDDYSDGLEFDDQLEETEFEKKRRRIYFEFLSGKPYSNFTTDEKKILDQISSKDKKQLKKEFDDQNQSTTDIKSPLEQPTDSIETPTETVTKKPSRLASLNASKTTELDNESLEIKDSCSGNTKQSTKKNPFSKK